MNINKDWRAFAEQDYLAIQALVDSDLFGLAAFHAQQAVEKWLKGLIMVQTQRVPRVHDLIVLAEDSGLEFTPDEQQVMEELNTVYTGTRYPGGMGGIAQHALTHKDIKRYQSFCNGLFKRVN